jgi:hypothetical protein
MLWGGRFVDNGRLAIMSDHIPQHCRGKPQLPYLAVWQVDETQVSD